MSNDLLDNEICLQDFKDPIQCDVMVERHGSSSYESEDERSKKNLDDDTLAGRCFIKKFSNFTFKSNVMYKNISVAKRKACLQPKKTRGNQISCNFKLKIFIFRI